jgi:hypothetical protein
LAIHIHVRALAAQFVAHPLGELLSPASLTAPFRPPPITICSPGTWRTLLSYDTAT